MCYGLQAIILKRVVIQINFAQFVLVGEDLPNLFGPNRRYVIVLQIQTQQCVVFFQRTGQSNDTTIFDVVVLEAHVFQAFDQGNRAAESLDLVVGHRLVHHVQLALFLVEVVDQLNRRRLEILAELLIALLRLFQCREQFALVEDGGQLLYYHAEVFESAVKTLG